MKNITYGYANEGATGNSKQCKSHFTIQLMCTWLSVINTKYASLCNEYLFSPRSHDR